METQQTKELKTEKYVHAMQNIVAQVLINGYTAENMLFGNIREGDEIPVERYVNELGLRNMRRFLDVERMDGSVIANGVVKPTDRDELCRNIFASKIDDVFGMGQTVEPVYTGFIDETYALFTAVLATEIEYDPFAPHAAARADKYCEKTASLVAAIGTNELKPDKCVERYIKGLPSLSPFLERLLTIKRKRRALAEVDTHGYDYKLAVLSCFKFLSDSNADIFEKKMIEWRKRNID